MSRRPTRAAQATTCCISDAATVQGTPDGARAFLAAAQRSGVTKADGEPFTRTYAVRLRSSPTGRATVSRARALRQVEGEHGIEPERPPYSVREGGSRLCFVEDADSQL